MNFIKKISTYTNGKMSVLLGRKNVNYRKLLIF